MNIPDETEEPEHEPVAAPQLGAPTWRQANRAEVWTWVGVGVGSVLVIELAGVLIYGLTLIS